MDEHELIQRLKSADDDGRRIAWDRFSGKLESYIRTQARVRVGQNPTNGLWQVDDSDVKDILAETFYQFFRDVPKFQEKSTLETYLHSIARKRAIDFYRAHERNNPRPVSSETPATKNQDTPPKAAAEPAEDTDFSEDDLDPKDLLNATREAETRRKLEKKLRKGAFAARSAGNWMSRPAEGRHLELYDALGRVTEAQRDVVVLRLIQGLTTEETAGVLAKTPGAVKMLLLRGLQALNEVMRNDNTAEKAEVILHE